MNTTTENPTTLPDRIYAWCRDQFAAKYADGVADDLIDVAAGNRAGTPWELSALDQIIPTVR